MLLWGVTELIILTDDAAYEKRLNGKCCCAACVMKALHRWNVD